MITFLKGLHCRDTVVDRMIELRTRSRTQTRQYNIITILQNSIIKFRQWFCAQAEINRGKQVQRARLKAISVKLVKLSRGNISRRIRQKAMSKT